MNPQSHLGATITRLSQRLPSFIQTTLQPHIGTIPWTTLLTEVDIAKGKPAKGHAASDLQAQLRIMTEKLGPFGFPFSDPTRQVPTMASELRVTRNRWAHNESVDWFDAFRAADTSVRLFSFIGDSEGRDDAEDHRRIALTELARALSLPGSDESARFLAERSAEATDTSDITVVPEASMTHRGGQSTPLLGDERLPFEAWTVTTMGDRSILDALPKKWAKEPVRALIAEIVEAEGPIIADRLATLVVRSFGMERAPANRKKQIIYQAKASNIHVDKSGFFWPADIDPETWTVFRPNDGTANRPFAEISPRELANAAVEVVRQHGSLPRSELNVTVLSTFGRRKQTKNHLKHLADSFESAAAQGRLHLNDNSAWAPVPTAPPVAADTEEQDRA